MDLINVISFKMTFNFETSKTLRVEGPSQLKNVSNFLFTLKQKLSLGKESYL